MGSEMCIRDRAKTGEINVSQLVNSHSDIKWGIVGHNDVRKFRNVTNGYVAEQVLSLHCLEKTIRPIICIGESLEVSDKGEEAVRSFLKGQLMMLEQSSFRFLCGIAIVYQPIGSDVLDSNGIPERVLSLKEIQARCSMIRSIVTDLKDDFDGALAGAVSILYGGILGKNALNDIASQPDINGALIEFFGNDPQEFRQTLVELSLIHI